MFRALNPIIDNKIILFGLNPDVAIEYFKAWYAEMIKQQPEFTYFSVTTGGKFSHELDSLVTSAFREYQEETFPKLFLCDEVLFRKYTFICHNIYSPYYDEDYVESELKNYHNEIAINFEYLNPTLNDIENELDLSFFPKNVALWYFIDWLQNRKELASSIILSSSFKVITGYRTSPHKELKSDDAIEDNTHTLLLNYLKSFGLVLSCASLYDQDGFICLNSNFK